MTATAQRTQPAWRIVGCVVASSLLCRVLPAGVHILVMLERSYFRNMAWADGKARGMDAFGVEHFHSLQVLKCHRQVLCEADQFEQALGVCRRHPEACAPDRPRVEVIQIEDTIGLLFQD